ncbi:MAG: radical SAM family heme chaperone HemW [Deltaproteobacteria bacterium]|jgi:oxygen-independent coproporphyrinogen-3 oxidase|nr:radical SAM family heme chaperone HemW [Deltaproteobacteria bacterium]
MNPGLYVHTPFCPRRCPYCDFYSTPELELIPQWLTALELEVNHHTPYWRTEVFDSIYLGGGSPSVLNADQLGALKKVISGLKLAPRAEITLEANPEDVSPEKVALWANWGVNRVSLGAQSFQERALQGPLGRTHGSADIGRAIKLIRKAKLALSLDLIFGWPGQEFNDWVLDLNQAVDFGVKHLSVYCLSTPLGSVLAQRLAAQELFAAPEGLVADMFLVAGDILKAAGLTRYEVSNFAKDGSFCRHNLKYWRRESYLGLGPGAHSFDGAKRSANTASIQKWAEALAHGRTSLSLVEDITPEQAVLESLMLGLRLAEGVPIKLLKDPSLAEKYVGEGYFTKAGGFLKPTEKGFLAADFLARALA